MKPLRTTAPLAFASLALLLASAASAGTVTQKRDLQGYSKIELKGSLDLEVTEGNGYAFELTAKDSEQSVYTTEVRGDTLVIGTKPGLHWHLGRALARITLPELRALRIDGSGDARAVSLSHPHDFDLEIHGSGDAKVSGSMAKGTVRIAGSGDATFTGGNAQALDIGIAGSGDVDAKALTTRMANVEVNGSGNVRTTLDGGPADFSVSGSGDIEWWGSAQPVQSHSSGSGDISHH